jgi:hypothetical protein
MAFREGKLKSEEDWWWQRIKPLIPADYPAWAGCGQRGNPLPCPETTEAFQFGDIRIETPTRTLLIEIERDGQGVSLVNLLKYWPWLKGEAGKPPTKPVTMLHVWGSSYPTSKVLWRRLKSELLDRASFVVHAEFIPFPNGRAEEEAAVLAVLGRHLRPAGEA